MKAYFVALSLVLCVPVYAQEGIVTAVQTIPETVLSPTFVRSSDYIVQGTWQLKKIEDETVGVTPYRQYKRLKGIPRFGIFSFDVSNVPQLKDGQEVLLFARYDNLRGRLIVTGQLPPTPSNIARVQQLVAQTPDFEISFSTDKTRYISGEKIKVTWTLKNISSQPKKIFTGEHSTYVGFSYDNGGMSISETDGWKRPALTEVKAGESWTHERTFEGRFPVGPVAIDWSYESDDIFSRRVALPSNMAFLSKGGNVAVEIVSPDKAQLKSLDDDLSGVLWDKQLAAAQQLLLINDAVQLKKLERFATHPFRPLRNVAAQAMVRSGEFSPALKTLYYSGTDVEARKFRGKNTDFALAALALTTVQGKAYKDNFKGKSPLIASDAFPLWSLPAVEDFRIGDLLMDRLVRKQPLEGGVNNGYELMYLTNVRVVVKDARLPLPDDVRNRVLEAWKTKRETVENLYTPAQLNAEIAIARKVRYDDFKVGAAYESVVQLWESNDQDSSDGMKRDDWNNRVMALPLGSLPDLWRVLQWREIINPPKSVLRRLAQLNDPDVFDYFLRIAYGEANLKGYSDGDAVIEAVRLMAQIDYERAKPHIENFLTYPAQSGYWGHDAPRIAAAISLAEHGDKRGVPIIFSPEYEKRYDFLDQKIVGAVLKTATGQDWPNLTQWQRWWKSDGVKMQWR